MKGERTPVAGATVRVDGIEETQATDTGGRFRFDAVAPGERRVTVEGDFIETLAATVSVAAGQTTTVDLYAFAAPFLLDEVVVESEREPADMTRRKITKDELDGIPGANADVFRVVKNLPGVAMSGIPTQYGAEGLVIRGTGPEDSKYFFNGFEIPQLFHFGALVSLINAELVEDIAYLPGGFGVNRGDSIGGYVEVTSRAPRNDRLGGAVDLSTYSAFVLVEGPFNARASGAAAVRRSTIDYILPEIVPEEEAAFTISPRFYDYTALSQWRLNSANRLSLVALGSHDRTKLLAEIDENEPFSPDAFDIEIGWHTAILDWDFAPTSRVTQSFAAQFLYLENDFRFGRDQNVEATVYYPAFLEEISVAAGDWNTLRFGANGVFVVYDTSGVLPLIPKEGDPAMSWTNADATRFSDNSRTLGLDGWVDDVMEPADWLRLVPGVRVNHLDLTGETTLDPRLSARFFPTEKSAIKTSAGVYHQWPDRDEMLPNLGNDDLGAEAAYETGAGFEYDFGQGYEIDAQGYYKRLDNVIARTGPDADVPYENSGRGYVWGAEILARKRLTDRLFGWMAYTYSVSRRKDAPDAEWRYFDEDQTHNAIALASYTFGQRKLWKLGGRFQFATGKPYTPIESAVYNAETDSYLAIYSEDINSRRERAFHQLDVRVDKRWIFNTWTLNAYLDLQNVYWQRYPVGYRYNFDYSERRAVSYPTFIPSFGMTARF